MRKPIALIRMAGPLVVALTLAAGGLAGDLRPERLRCEYAENPLAIDAGRPRLSWHCHCALPKRGLRQTAYQVLVSASVDALAKGRGDLWDSGKVDSDRSVHVEYAGRPLASHQQCFWKVRVWDQAGQGGHWSDVATWTMGLLQPADWQAQWIGQAPSPDRAAAPGAAAMPVFRHGFDVPPGKAVRRALLYACGLGQHELHLNGQKVGQAVIEPSWSNYRRTCYYGTYDVTGLIRPGANAVGAMLGNGMYNVVGGRYVKFRGSFGPPKLICQLEIEHTDGTRTVVASDERWKWAAGPIVFSCTFGGEDYDARREQAGWDAPGYDDSSWSPARTTDGPGGVLRAEAVEPVRALREYRTIKVMRIKPGLHVFDLGQNFSGWPRIRVRGKAGATVKLTPGELLDDRKRVSQRSSGGPMSFSYTLKGDPQGETWRPRFTYYGFRYVEVEGASPTRPVGAASAPLDEGATCLDELVGEFLYTDAETVGRVECGHQTLNRIHWLINAAILSNFKSVLTDCPHREKLGWLEVSHLLADSILYNYDGARFYEKICRDMREAQLDNGLVPDIAPEFTVFSGGFRDSPEWGSACVVNPWVLWQTYGDRRALEENYETMKRYTNYLASRADARGIVAHGLGDWCDVGPRGPGPSQLTSLGVTSTAMLFNNLRILERSARVLGKTDEANAFAGRATAVREAFQKAFFHADRSNYDRNSQAANAIPLALDIADADRRPAILKNLVWDIRANENRVTAGDVGFTYVVRALTDSGNGDVIYDMLVQDSGPGYVYQLRKGATALVETWDANPQTSQNHCMLGHAEQWYYTGLAGINRDPAGAGRQGRSQCELPLGPGSTRNGGKTSVNGVGFQRFVLRPQVVGEVRWVKAHYDSIHGRITSHWRLEDGRFVWEFTVPPNTTATVHVPTKTPDAVTESDRPVAEAEGVKLLGTQAGAAVYAVPSGRYRFAAPRGE